MPSLLSKIRSKSSNKEKEALAESERNNSSGSSSPPPTYANAEVPSGYDEENALEPPDLTSGFNSLTLESTSNEVPTHEECIAHLKVLEAFYKLRQTIGSSDGLFGIDNSLVTGHGLPNEDSTAELLAKLAEKRWAVYVARAVDRFQAWCAAVAPSSGMLTLSELETEGPKGTLVEPSNAKGAKINLTPDNMPPIDVLLVWHAYMLNPRAYLEDCLRYGRMALWHTRFPWKTAVTCVDSKTFIYDVSQDAKSLFEGATNTTWDNLASTQPKRLWCTSCDNELHTAWTTCTDTSPSSAFGGSIRTNKDLSVAIDMMLTSGKGYCDQGLSVVCTSCKKTNTHDNLKVGKFRTDLKRLLQGQVPMAGAVLGSSYGLPHQVGKTSDVSCNANLLPNQLLMLGPGKRMASTTGLATMDEVRDEIEQATHDRPMMAKARGSPSSRMQRTERVAIRKMMSRYWENSTPFALDLVGAVVRQGSFIEKMHNIDWLHSPALPSTMKRLLVKYSRFVEIMKNHLQMAVPTLDVDLAWHTHQLNPYGYLQYTVAATKQFIDHDDKVAETKLNDQFAWTSKTYQKTYGEPYSECTCWYCEAVRESHTSAASRLFKSSNAKAAEQLHSADQDPRKSVHISAHNAIRPRDDTNEYQLKAKMQAEALEKEYQKACDRATKKGKKPPKRDDYYYSDAWGYPVYMPAYSPYIGYMPYAAMYYPVTPGCAAVGAGMAGNCAAGTCGGGVAAGGCGGGGGGCAGYVVST